MGLQRSGFFGAVLILVGVAPKRFMPKNLVAVETGYGFIQPVCPTPR